MLKYINITKNIKERIVEAQHNVILAFFFFLFSLKLNTIKTIDKIKEATLDELLNVKEMDSKSAQSVYEYFRRNSDV